MPRYLPKSIVCFREGYTARSALSDVLAGITVGIIALPLAIAFGIASIPEGVSLPAGLSPPAMGLFTAVVAGFLISILGGSRVQIGGPTGAFIVLVALTAKQFGYSGLATATLMAGVIIILMGLFRFGAVIKFIPYPVTTGFTSGIAVIIFSTQINNFLGLQLQKVPEDFVAQWQIYFHRIVEVAEQWFVQAPLADPTAAWTPHAMLVGLGSLVALFGLRRFAPRLPGAIVVVLLASAVVYLFHLPVNTIGSRFGENAIPRGLPAPHLPPFDFSRFRELLPTAFTIAMLAGIESLLSAVVADGMTGGRHKTDCELVAQGIANIAVVFFGGIPATGAIARTAANVKSGGRTPLSGMVHAVTLLVVMILLAPQAVRIPMATLAAILIMVAWNMSEVDHFRNLLKAPKSDIVVLLSTFALTVFVNLPTAVGVGTVMASMLFMKRMADVSTINAIRQELEDGADDLAELKDPNALITRKVPPGVEVYEINGPFFFGVADRLKDTLSGLERPPQVFILRMRRVPSIDASGMHALKEFYEKCHRQGTTLLLSGVHAQPLFVFTKYRFKEVIGIDNMFGNIDDALNRARELMGLPTVSRPVTALSEVAREEDRESSRKGSS
ncbi:MAG: sulfate permease [Planctomycetes bacterium]|nr:sulfate permease [Planctomycetota bacterium]